MTDTALPMRRPRGLVLAVLAVTAAVGAWLAVSSADPQDVTLGPIAGYVVVQSQGSADLHLLDMATDTVAGSVTLPVVPDTVLVARETGRILYANRAAKQIGFFDIATRQTTAVLDMPLVPEVLTISPDGLTLAVADRSGGRLALIRITEETILASLDGLDLPDAMAFSNDSSFLFLSDTASGALRVFDALNGNQLDPITLSIRGPPAPVAPGKGLSAVTRTPNGLFGVVVDQSTGHMAVINFRSWLEAEHLELGAGATRPYVTADGRYMMVASEAATTDGAPGVTVISTDIFAPAARLPGLSGVTSMATGYFETLAFAVSATERKALVIDLETMAIAGEIAFPATPGPAMVEAEGRRMYVPLRETGQIAVIDVFNKRIHKIVDGVGDAPVAIAMAASNNYCH